MSVCVSEWLNGMRHVENPINDRCNGGVLQPVPDRDLKWPSISVITPCLNAAQYVEQTILSVRRQSYPHVQHIVIDGGSTDGTVSILERYGDELLWRSEPDAGQSDALAKALSLATGDIITWQNADDIFLPGAFHEVASALCKRPDIGLVFGNMLLIDGDNRVMREVRFTPVSLSRLPFLAISLANQALFWKRAGAERCVPDRSLQHCMDFELFFQLLKVHKSLHLRSFLGAFRCHADTKTFKAGATRGLSEKRSVVTRYGPPPGSWRFRIGRIATLLTKAGYHVVNGESMYLVREVRARLRARLDGKPYIWHGPL